MIEAHDPVKRVPHKHHDIIAREPILRIITLPHNFVRGHVMEMVHLRIRRYMLPDSSTHKRADRRAPRLHRMKEYQTFALVEKHYGVSFKSPPIRTMFPLLL